MLFLAQTRYIELLCPLDHIMCIVLLVHDYDHAIRGCRHLHRRVDDAAVVFLPLPVQSVQTDHTSTYTLLFYPFSFSFLLTLYVSSISIITSPDEKSACFFLPVSFSIYFHCVFSAYCGSKSAWSPDF